MVVTLLKKINILFGRKFTNYLRKKFVFIFYQLETPTKKNMKNDVNEKNCDSVFIRCHVF